MPTSILKSLDEKLQRIALGTAKRQDFILADAKDADMAFGLAATGLRSGISTTDVNPWRTRSEYIDEIRAVIRQGVVDLVLLSASNLEHLAITEQAFARSPVTAAARANDSTDIWVVRHGCYPKEPSRPFRSASIDHIKYGRLMEDHRSEVRGANLGLYSLTFNNRVDDDLRTLEHYHAFRLEAERKQFRHFLEVFCPNVDTGLTAQQVGDFLNDHIARTLAGITKAGRPLFLKIPYLGPRALEDLVGYDPTLPIGILGGGAGTTLDAFQLLHLAQKHGARLALFGRKINQAEDPLAFIRYLRRIADGEIMPREAVRAYHDDLICQGISARRTLEDDSMITDALLHEP